MRRHYRHTATCACSLCARAGRPVTTTVDRGDTFTPRDLIVIAGVAGLLGTCAIIDAVDLIGRLH